MKEFAAWEREAREFLERDTEFRLGFLPSEARNPLTMRLDEDFRASTETGVRTLWACDRALLPHVEAALASSEFAAMTAAMRRARRVVFSGCGAGGRLAILLESAWNEAHPADGRVLSIMTGGDYALIRSVEHFEDYLEVGRRQVRDLGFGREDVLVGITATGETASVLGTAMEAAEQGAEVFMLICVPLESAASRLERCRRLYALPNVHVIAMPIGGMALTGSTRMQSSTIEVLVAAAALESATDGAACDYAAAYAQMLDGLESAASVQALARCIDAEAAVYQAHGLVDYVAEDLLVDLLSDTTERSPTFMIPPYKARGDLASPQPWAMVRAPAWTPREFWRHCLGRAPRCIAWSEEDYRREGLECLMAKGVPQIDEAALLAFPVAGEAPGREASRRVAIVNDGAGSLSIDDHAVGAAVPPTPLRLFEHLRAKQVMNILSTGTMVKLGRVRGNYMIHLAISNKKLVDRATRIISELCGVPYEEACRELFRTRASIDERLLSPVAETIRRLSGH